MAETPTNTEASARTGRLRSSQAAALRRRSLGGGIDLSANLQQRANNLRDTSYQAVQSRFERFESEHPDFAKYIQTKGEELKEDGDLKKTAEGIAADAKRYQQGIESTTGVGTLKLYYRALEKGYTLAAKLDAQIKKGNNTGWMFALFLAVLKDAFDFQLMLASLPPLPTAVFGPITDTIITLFFFAFFFRFLWGKGTFMFRFIMSRIGPMLIVELIPFLSFFPLYTFTILYAWMKMSQKIRKLEEERNAMTHSLDKLKKETSTQAAA